MNKSILECTRCKKNFEFSNIYHCDECQGILEVKLNYSDILKKPISEIFPQCGFNIWKYQHLLPVHDPAYMVTLHEGGTPLLKSANLSEKIGLVNLYFKEESRNPSGSFKDRAMAVGVSKAKEFGFNIVTTASSGNGAASLSAYSAKAKLKSYVFVPENTAFGKVAQTITNGGIVIRVKGSYSDSFNLALLASEKFDWMNITTTFLNPYAVEGDKTVSYELFSQLDKNVPDWIFIPTGAGPLVYGICKGFVEIMEFGLTDKLPRIVAVQAEGCSPIVRAYETGKNVIKWENPDTIATAIADPLVGYEFDGERVLKVIKETNGLAVSVTDAAILDSVRDLARNEGVYSEPGAAAAFAGFRKVFNQNLIKKDEVCVCVITGSGLKDPDSAVKNVETILIEPEFNKLLEYLNKSMNT